VFTSYQFSSSAAAPACATNGANVSHDSLVCPLIEPMTGILTACVARYRCSAYSCGSNGYSERAGKIADHLGEARIGRVHMGDSPLAGQADLLLEQRMQHDGRAPGILEPLHGIEVIAEWRRACDERMREAQSEV
jgi:hypothetical protein